MIKKSLFQLIFFTLLVIKATPLGATVGDLAWANAQLETYPELYWLADKDVRQTQEGISVRSNTKLSQLLFGKSYDELDRTLHTLKDLELFLQGDEEAYKIFTKNQPAEAVFTFASFKAAGDAARALIKQNSDLKDAMKMALIFGDMGKTKEARRLAKEHHIEEPDHDHFLHLVLDKCPDIFPSYKKLSPLVKQWLQKELPIHLGHLTHLEGGPEMLTLLKKANIAKTNPEVIDFFLFVHSCDIAGALAHVNSEGSLTYNENIHQTMVIIGETLKLLATQNETTALKYYIKKRAEWLCLNSETKEGRVLTRIGAMVRFYTPQQGTMLKKTFLQLHQKSTILKRFDPLIGWQGRTPTYIPAVLLNLKDNPKCGNTPEERLAFTLDRGLTFILKVTHDHESQITRLKNPKSLNKNGSVLSNLENLTLCFNATAKQAKESPEVFMFNKFKVDQEGNVTGIK